MWRRLLNAALLALATVVLWFASENYVYTNLRRTYHTFLALTLLYMVFKVVFEGMVSKRIANEKTRYVFRKSVSILFIAVFAVVLIRVWVENPEALLVAYGVVGAGVAVALQDVFKNFAGSIVLFTNNVYQVGDRIEVQGTVGDVIDIGLFYTKVLEAREWVQGDQSTGRIVDLPNGYVLGDTIKNYTENNSFLWDEMTLPITYESDWRMAVEEIKEVVKEVTGDISGKAEKEIREMRKKYYLSGRDTQPDVYLELTDNWINFHIRYTTDARERRVVHNRLARKLLERIEELDDVELASETVDIVGFPGRDQA